MLSFEKQWWQLLKCSDMAFVYFTNRVKNNCCCCSISIDEDVSLRRVTEMAFETMQLNDACIG